MKKTFVVGIDEAGRGPLAGPVAVGGVCISNDLYKGILALSKKIGVRDSKKLSPIRRKELYEQVNIWQKEGKVLYAVALISAKHIDTEGIAVSIRKGIAKVLKKITPHTESAMVLLDGGIYAPKEYISQKTIIKGDDKEPIISLASIMAKVTRDMYMNKVHKKHPEYLFDTHKGYGTKGHYRAITKYGIIKEHRKTFLKNIKLD